MKCEYQVTKQLMRSWVMENRFSGVNLVLFILWTVLLSFWIPVTMLLILIQARMSIILMGIFFCVVAIYKIIGQRLLSASVQYKTYAKIYGANWTRTIEFMDDCIQITEGSSTHRHPYSVVSKVDEKDNIIWLYCENKSALRLYKDKFVDGTWEECRKLMQERNELLR